MCTIMLIKNLLKLSTECYFKYFIKLIKLPQEVLCSPDNLENGKSMTTRCLHYCRYSPTASQKMASESMVKLAATEYLKHFLGLTRKDSCLGKQSKSVGLRTSFLRCKSVQFGCLEAVVLHKKPHVLICSKLCKLCYRRV